MNGAKQDPPKRRTDIMPQQIGGQVRQRVQKCLKAARRDIYVEAAVQQGKGTVLMVVSPVPIDVFAAKPGVKGTGEKRSKDHGRHCKVFARNHGFSASSQNPVRIGAESCEEITTFD